MDGYAQRTAPSDLLMPFLARRVREIGSVFNWLFAMLVGEEGCQLPSR